MREGAPRPTLSLFDVVAATAGVVIGAGLFRLPSTVAGHLGSEPWIIAAWVAGGVISLIGALCYAELAAAFPSAGGEYHFLSGAFGPRVGFLFAWARVTVAQTGNIVLLAFVFGDYLSSAVPLGDYGSSICAAVSVIGITAINAAGLRFTVALQRALFGLTLVGLTTIVVVGMAVGPVTAAPVPPAATPSLAAIGSAMIFVLFTYGGWNEAAYISAEVRNGPRNMARALLISIGVITTFYVAVNWTYLHVLGVDGVANSTVVAADVMRVDISDNAAAFMTALILVLVLKSMNVATMTGARTSFALGRDFPALRFLGHWDGDRDAPEQALWVQCGMSLVLVALGSASRGGVETAIDYLSPVFWLFFLLTGVALFVLRVRYPTTARPFRVPLYPLTPILFCAVSAFMLYASIRFSGIGAVIGLGVLGLGMPLMLLLKPAPTRFS